LIGIKEYTGQAERDGRRAPTATGPWICTTISQKSLSISALFIHLHFSSIEQ